MITGPEEISYKLPLKYVKLVKKRVCSLRYHVPLSYRKIGDGSQTSFCFFNFFNYKNAFKYTPNFKKNGNLIKINSDKPRGS